MARVSNKNSPITTHAYCYSIDYAFGRLLGYSNNKIIEIKANIADLLKKLYSSVELSYGTTGELAIDIGIDNSGKLWFIECNAFSAKVSFDRVYGAAYIYKFYYNLIKYAIYLYESST